MYRNEIWAFSSYAGHPTPELSNKLWKNMVNAGSSAFTVAYDLPTQVAYDPDHPMAEGEVGRVGVSMCSLNDWEVAFDGLDVNKLRITHGPNSLSLAQIACHAIIAEEQGGGPETIAGTSLGDVLMEYSARGSFIFPPEESMRFLSDGLVYAAEHMPKFSPIMVAGVHLSERGATPVHEMACMLADAFAYFQAAVDRGIDIDLIAPGVSFDPSGDHDNFFQEIAKLRAARRIYARVMKEKFGAKDPRSMMARWYVSNAGHCLHKEQYLNNLSRITLGCLLAVLSGCQYIDARTYDEQFGIPTQEAQVDTIRLQNVIAHETGITDTVDPLGGSYFIESLTSEFEERITKELETIDKLGGAVKCVERGYFRRQFSEDAYRWERAFKKGEVLRVGVNIYRSEEEEARPTRIYRADPKVEQERTKAVRRLRRKRDNRKVKKTLDEVRAIAALPPTPDNNLMYPIIEAMKAYATIQEIGDVLREEWGEFVQPSIF